MCWYFTALFLHDVILHTYLTWKLLTVAKSCAHFSTSFSISCWSMDSMVEVVKKCFSSRLMSGVGNSLYTTFMSAITTSLQNNHAKNLLALQVSIIFVIFKVTVLCKMENQAFRKHGFCCHIANSFFFSLLLSNHFTVGSFFFLSYLLEKSLFKLLEKSHPID